MEEKIKYSVVIPFYNEELSIEKLLGAVVNIMKDLNEPYEIIAVNDGSSDGTCEILDKIHEKNHAVIPVHFPSNKGQTASLAEGFRRTAGCIVISMDGDLQDDPLEIPSMLDAFKKSKTDVLCGWRADRKDATRTLFLSRLGNFFQRRFFNMPVHDISCTFRVYKRKAVKSLVLKEEGLHRFLPFLLKRTGFSLDEKKVHHRPRGYGLSKYSLKKAPETTRLFFEILFGKH